MNRTLCNFLVLFCGPSLYSNCDVIKSLQKGSDSKVEKLIKEPKDQGKVEDSPSKNDKDAGMCPQSVLEWSKDCNLFGLLKGKMLRKSRYKCTFHFLLFK